MNVVNLMLRNYYTLQLAEFLKIPLKTALHVNYKTDYG